MLRHRACSLIDADYMRAWISIWYDSMNNWEKKIEKIQYKYWKRKTKRERVEKETDLTNSPAEPIEKCAIFELGISKLIDI